MVDPTTGRDRKIGLADFENGYEIKTLLEASSFNTVDGYIKNASRKKKKQGFAQVVIDVSENANLSDDEAREYIQLGLNRHGMKSALMVNHSKRIETVWA